MLESTRYPGYVHVTDILLIKIIVKLILKKFNGTELKVITEKAKQVLDGLNNFSKMKDKGLETKKIIAKYGKASDKGKSMKDLLPEHIYLYDQLIEI